MKIQRPFYLELLKNKRDNGMIKIITGIRRVGKTYLLKDIYRDYLVKNGLSRDQIIVLDLDEVKLKTQGRDITFSLMKYKNHLLLIILSSTSLARKLLLLIQF